MPDYNELKAMLPHILFHADRVKALYRRNSLVCRSERDYFFSEIDVERFNVTKCETVPWRQPDA